MKKTAIAALAAASLLLAGCSEDTKTIDGVKYTSYGLLNEETNHNPRIRYEVKASSVILGIVLIETVVAPIYFFGFDLYEPVGPLVENDKSNNGVVK